MQYNNIIKLQEIYDSNISRPGLECIIELLRLLGNPQDKLRCVHVAGTNGKGSTCAYIESIMRVAGYRTGLFTSPHINGLNDYIKIDNELISDEDLDKYAGSIFDVCNKMVERGYKHPTFFEIIVAIIFKYFYDKKVDIAIIEVGMGGLKDATNVMIPVLSVITTIGLDHTAYLGDTIEKIAIQKAGIIKENVPVVVSPMQDISVIEVFNERCRELNSNYIDAGRYDVDILVSTIELQHLKIYDDKTSYDIKLKSIGNHQIRNVMTAITAIRELVNSGYTVYSSAIENGVNAAYLENRIEYIKDKNMIIDNSHNPQGVRELRLVMDNYYNDKKIVLVCSILSTKDVDSMIDEYESFVDYAFITKSSNLLAMSPSELSLQFTKHGIVNKACKEIREAILLARQKCQEENAVLLISGSSYIISNVRRIISS